MATPDLLYTLGRNVKERLKGIEDFDLPPALLEGFGRLLEANTQTFSSVHKAVGASIFAGGDAIIIREGSHGDSRLHKLTSTYILPILQIENGYSKTAFHHKRKNTSVGPTILILTASVTTALRIETYLQTLIHGKCNPPISAKYVDTNVSLNDVPKLIVSDIESVEVMRNRASNGRILFRRLVFLVIEEADVFSDQQWELLEDIIDVAQEFQSSVRLVITSSKWTDKLEAFYMNHLKLKNLNLFIDYLPEVIRFSKILWKVDRVKEGERMEKMIELLQNVAKKEKVIVSCSSPEQATHIKEACLDSALDVKILDDEAGMTKFIEPVVSASQSILIVPDEMILKAKVSECTYLINFDSGRNQRFRMWYLWESLPKFHSQDGLLQRKSLTINYFMSGEEENFLPFYRFSGLLDKVEMSPELEVIGRKIHAEAMDKKPLCKNIMLFGSCIQKDIASCYLRHHFNESDCEAYPVAPGYGWIEFIVLECISPSQYVGLLTKHYATENGQRKLIKSFTEEALERQKALTEYYSDENNGKLPLSVKVGGIYAYTYSPSSQKTYKRVRILAKLGGKSRGDPNKISILDNVFIQCLETGEKEQAKASDMKVLAPEFLKWPTHVVKIVLGNICPPKSDFKYTPDQLLGATRFVSHSEFLAKVWISLGDTVWVKDMISAKDYTWSVRSKLISSEVVNNNRPHLQYLTNSIKSLGSKYTWIKDLPDLSPNEILPRKEFQQKGDGFDWAHVPISCEDFIESANIIVTWAHNPWLFYGTLRKNQKLLDDLELELTQSIANAWLKGDPKYYTSLGVDSVVAVKRESEEGWARGLVSEVHHEGTCRKFDIFLVDSGEQLWDVEVAAIQPILKKLVTKLPFQCIAFSLGHIEPSAEDGTWSQSDIDLFLDLVVPDERGRMFTVVALGKRDEDTDIPCRYYDVVAMPTGDFDSEIGGILVQKSCAVATGNVDAIMNALRNHDVTTSIPTTDDFAFEADDEDDLLERFDMNLGVTNPDCPDWVDDIVSATKAQLEELKVSVTKNEAASKAISPSDTRPEPRPSTSSSDDQPKLELTEEQELIRVVNDCFLHPVVLWHQTKDLIILTVQLPDIAYYELDISTPGRTLRFQTRKPGANKDHGFYVKLFGKVLNDPIVLITGLHLTIKLKKFVGNNVWCRLLDDKLDNPVWLKQNLAYFEESSEEEKEEECSSVIRQSYSEKFEKYDSSDSDDIDNDDIWLRALNHSDDMYFESDAM